MWHHCTPLVTQNPSGCLQLPSIPTCNHCNQHTRLDTAWNVQHDWNNLIYSHLCAVPMQLQSIRSCEIPLQASCRDRGMFSNCLYCQLVSTSEPNAACLRCLPYTDLIMHTWIIHVRLYHTGNTRAHMICTTSVLEKLNTSANCFRRCHSFNIQLMLSLNVNRLRRY